MTAEKLRVIDDEGKQIGVISKSEALKLALEADLDLVEIAPEANPPVAKIIEFKKFKYLEDKKEKEARKHAKQTELKEVRVSPFIGDHDLNTALGRVKKFLGAGDLVKISVVFKGRQMAHQEFGPKLLARIMVELSGLAEIDRPERMEGRRFVTVLKPAKGAPINKKPSVIKIQEGKQETDNPKKEDKSNKPKTEDNKQESIVDRPNHEAKN